MLDEIKHKRLIHDQLNVLRHSIDSHRVFLPNHLSRFVFLCGANKSSAEISERRRALIDFAEAQLQHTHFFLAERMFDTLKKEGHKGNLLDVEQLISDFSDYVLIVLESQSAFAELGAFSNGTLRDKLIVINDARFENSESFINFGPISAIKESAGPKRVIYYKMSDNGVFQKDAIGNTFYQIYELFKEPIHSRKKPINLESLHPGANFNKYSAMFLHDIVYMTGPVLHGEIIEIIMRIFGKYKFNRVSHLLAILCAFMSLERNSDGLYRSTKNDFYYQYMFDLGPIMSAFRNISQKKYPDRLYAY